MAIPTISNINTPNTYAFTGSVITITGTNYISGAGNNTVTIGGNAATVLTASTTVITAQVAASTPVGSQPLGTQSVVVTNSNGSSIGTNFIFYTYGGLGEFDTNGLGSGGQWMDSSGIYFGSGLGLRYTVGSGLNTNNGFVGLSWLQNIFTLARTAWSKFLGNPAGGQVYPTNCAPPQGQINPN